MTERFIASGLIGGPKIFQNPPAFSMSTTSALVRGFSTGLGVWVSCDGSIEPQRASPEARTIATRTSRITASLSVQTVCLSDTKASIKPAGMCIAKNKASDGWLQGRIVAQRQLSIKDQELNLNRSIFR